MSDTDSELLARFARHGAEDAFAELVRRHLGLVYAAALRQVRSPQLAEEVAQSAFIDLARTATRLTPDTILAAWLYQVTRRTAIDVVRRETSRRSRERTAIEIDAMNAAAADGSRPNSLESDAGWREIEPLLDDAMQALDEIDRAAVLLRYFENKSLREVGCALGASENAAQKRLSRAVERLRELLAERGVTAGASGLIVALSANAAQTAPAGLAAAITASAALPLVTGATSGSLAATTHAIAMTTLQKTLVAATLAMAVGTGIYQTRQAANWRSRAEALQKPSAAEAELLAREREEERRQLAQLRQENERLNRDAAELRKLRGDVGRMRTELQELARSKPGENSGPMTREASALLNRVNLLKERLEQRPDQKIPELKYVSDQVWLRAASGQLESDEDFRRALGAVRNAGESAFANLLSTAMKNYLAANNGAFPSEITQLRPYFEAAVDDESLQRWEIVPAGKLKSIQLQGDSPWLMTQKRPVDEEHDSRLAVGTNGIGSVNFFRDLMMASLDGLFKAYRAAHDGQLPADLAALAPFLTTPEEESALRRALEFEARQAAIHR